VLQERTTKAVMYDCHRGGGIEWERDSFGDLCHGAGVWSSSLAAGEMKTSGTCQTPGRSFGQNSFRIISFATLTLVTG